MWLQQEHRGVAIRGVLPNANHPKSETRRTAQFAAIRVSFDGPNLPLLVNALKAYPSKVEWRLSRLEPCPGNGLKQEVTGAQLILVQSHGEIARDVNVFYTYIRLEPGFVASVDPR